MLRPARFTAAAAVVAVLVVVCVLVWFTQRTSPRRAAASAAGLTSTQASDSTTALRPNAKTITPPSVVETLSNSGAPAGSAAPGRSLLSPEAALHDSKVLEDVRQQEIASLREVYDPLLTSLDVSAEQRESFYRIQQAYDDPVMLLEKGPFETKDVAERAQINAKIRDIRSHAQEQLQGLLGPEGYQRYIETRAVAHGRASGFAYPLSDERTYVARAIEVIAR